jgi:hypothetical protein
LFDLISQLADLIIHIRSRKQMFTKRYTIERHHIMQGGGRRDITTSAVLSMLFFPLHFQWKRQPLLPAHDHPLWPVQPQGYIGDRNLPLFLRGGLFQVIDQHRCRFAGAKKEDVFHDIVIRFGFKYNE